MRLKSLRLALLAAVFVAVAWASSSLHADEPWVIRSFDATYAVQQDGSVVVSEDLLVDFGALERHGIFRDIPVRYPVDGRTSRAITITAIRVDNGATAVPFTTSRVGRDLRLKIGDADEFVSGQQRYRISYTVSGPLNAFDDHDELFWNVTGNDWQVPIDAVTARLTLPKPGLERVTCYQGPAGSTAPCRSSNDDTTATFAASRPLPTGSGLTIVAAWPKGLVDVPPPVLVKEKTAAQQVSDFLGLTLPVIAITALTAVAALALLYRQWWIAGRDRWYGKDYYVGGEALDQTRAPFAHETVVVEYEPPEVARRGRRLRPAEIGLLLDERADTLDVTATIVDLAVRGYLRIEEQREGGWLIFGRSTDHKLVRIKPPDDALLPYEAGLMDALFDDGETVLMSEIKGKFASDLAKVKSRLYDEAVKTNKFFPRDPEHVRNLYRGAGIALAVLGAVAFFALGAWLGAAVIGIPIVVAGVLLFFIAPVMPRRTAAGRDMYRRCLGFRRFVSVAETERQRFFERENIFEQYLPYAIVFGCVDRWAKAFKDLGMEDRQMSWYVGPGGAPFTYASAMSLGAFSSSVSSVMAATPGGAGGGGSGFGGGGFSGGGFGGGGGGSW